MTRTSYPLNIPEIPVDQGELTPAGMAALCNSFARKGRTDHWIATALGLDVNDVRKAIAEARRAKA
jgi:hypothetical protein